MGLVFSNPVSTEEIELHTFRSKKYSLETNLQKYADKIDDLRIQKIYYERELDSLKQITDEELLHNKKAREAFLPEYIYIDSVNGSFKYNNIVRVNAFIIARKDTDINDVCIVINTNSSCGCGDSDNQYTMYTQPTIEGLKKYMFVMYFLPDSRLKQIFAGYTPDLRYYEKSLIYPCLCT